MVVKTKKQHKMKKRNLENAWSTNESLLQGYRSTFIGSQSFLIAVGAVLLDSKKSDFLLYGLAVISFFMIWYIWFRVVRSRGLIVDYYKLQITTDIRNHPDFCQDENTYVNAHTKHKRYAMNKACNCYRNWRKTRIKIDLILPIIFTILWVALAATNYFS